MLSSHCDDGSGSFTPPPPDHEASYALGEEIASFAARVDVAMHAMLTRLRRFDAMNGWGPGGFTTCAHWLAWRTHIQANTAREHVRVAWALAELPVVDALFARGELSYSKVRAITRIATPQTEEALVEIAKHSTASQVARLFRQYARCLEDPQGPREQRRHVHRSETIDGMVRFEIVLPPEEAAIVWEAMEAAMDTARRTTDADPDPEHAPAEAPVPMDAARCTTDTLDADPVHDEPEFEHAPAEAAVPKPAVSQSRADAIVDVARAYLQHRPRTLGSAYELVVVTTQDQLDTGPGGIGGFLRDGTPIPLHIARMLAHVGSRVDVVLGEHGELLDVGRRTRAIPSAIARGLWLRDGGCRVPGCGRTRHLHAHHIHGWADGGPTKLGNLVLVCSTHHRMIHEGALAVKLQAGEEPAHQRVTFIDQRDRVIPRFPATSANLDELEHWLREAEVHIDPALTQPKWDGRPMDLQDSLTWMLMGPDPRLRGSVGPKPRSG